MKLYRAAWALLFGTVMQSLIPISYADDALVRATRIALPVEIDFDPVGASCILRRRGQPEMVRGLFVPEDSNSRNDSKRSDSDGTTVRRTWIVCCPVPEGVVADGEVSVVIEREGREAVVRSAQAESFYEFEATLDSEDKAKQFLVKQREILASYQVQLKTQQQALARLRKDADLIGEQGSLSARERQLASEEDQLKSLNRERLNLEESVKMIRLQPAPLNSATMEVEITRQLADMAQVARVAESSEGERQAAGHGDLAMKMRLIEESRFEDLEAIRAELFKLRRRRQELEESLQISSEAPLDYE